ncbi:adenosylcobinamide-GDP ribazoletransferase [bacterium LRH843]|nr:adenosylcobinamide-GDP ribazoletransferase [bacterium LRH843]
MLKVMLDGFLLSMQLLTTIPVTKQVQWDDQRAKASVAAYPLVGLILGSLLAVQAYVLIEWTSLSSVIIAAYIMTFSLVYSGGLHVDGWADFHDAVFSRRDREKKLAIMKDPQVGTFAVLAVLFLLSWRFLFLYELNTRSFAGLLFALVMIPMLTRLVMGWHLLLGSFAREDGMAVSLKAVKCKEMKMIYIGWTGLVFLVTLIFSPLFLSLIIGAGIFLFCWQKWVHFQLGGITGDTIGAGAEGSETVLWGILWFLLSFGMV